MIKVTIELEEDDLAALRACADEARLSLDDWMRHVIRVARQRHPQRPGPRGHLVAVKKSDT